MFYLRAYGRIVLDEHVNRVHYLYRLYYDYNMYLLTKEKRTACYVTNINSLSIAEIEIAITHGWPSVLDSMLLD